MKKSATTYVLAACGLAVALPQAAYALNAQQVVESIAANGLVAPYNLEKTGHYWQAQATTPDGKKAYVVVNDVDGQFTAISTSDLGTRYPGVAQVVAHLRALGYTQIQEVEFDDGFWHVEVRPNLQAYKQELLLHPVTLEIVQPTQSTTLTAAHIVDVLQRAGYTRITDVSFDDGVWEAEATNAQKQRVDLKLDPDTATIISEKLDD